MLVGRIARIQDFSRRAVPVAEVDMNQIVVVLREVLRQRQSGYCHVSSWPAPRCGRQRPRSMLSRFVTTFTHEEDAGAEVRVLLPERVAALQIGVGDDVGLQQPVELEVRQRLEEDA